MSELLRCENLCKKYASVCALQEIDLTLESGRIVGLLGPNGSGKTTLIKIMNGLLRPTSGRVLIDGKEPGVESKRLIAYLPDNDFLDSRMTVRQIVTMFSEFFADFRVERAYEMLAHLAIDPAARLKTLSKGNREKVALILTMSRNARLYVLDEPIAGVDPATRDYIISTILNNYNPEATVLISTHLIADIEPILHEVIFLQKGKLLLHQSVEQLRAENEGKTVDALFREVFQW